MRAHNCLQIQFQGIDHFLLASLGTRYTHGTGRTSICINYFFFKENDSYIFMLHKGYNIKENTKYHRIEILQSQSTSLLYRTVSKEKIWGELRNNPLGLSMKDYKLG